MALITAQDYILNALRKCGQIRPGYTPQPELLQDGLDEWKLMFDGYNAERTMNYSRPDYVFPVTGPGHGTTGNGQTFGGSGYLIGPTAVDFVAPRPVEICRMNLYMTSASPAAPTRIPMSPISMDDWMRIAVINLTPINVAMCFAYDPQWPNGVVWVWPPLNGNSLEIFTWGQLTPPSSLSTTYNAPPGYGDVVVWRLAARLWPLCTKDVMVHRVTHQYLCGQAAIAAAKVRAVNAPKPRLTCDFMSGGGHTSGSSDWGLLLGGTPY
jgi:hypothetical protein